MPIWAIGNNYFSITQILILRSLLACFIKKLPYLEATKYQNFDNDNSFVICK